MLRGEIRNLTERAEGRAAEIRRLQNTLESYKLSNEELNVSCCLFLHSLVEERLSDLPLFVLFFPSSIRPMMQHRTRDF